MDNQNISNNMTLFNTTEKVMSRKQNGQEYLLLCGCQRFCMRYFILFVCIIIFTALPCRYLQQVQLSTVHML